MQKPKARRRGLLEPCYQDFLEPFELLEPPGELLEACDFDGCGAAAGAVCDFGGGGRTLFGGGFWLLIEAASSA